MQILSEQEIIWRLHHLEPISAIVESGAFSIRVDRYVPAVWTAIHNGHGIDPEIEGNLLLSPNERLYEEDPFTGDMLAPYPIALHGLHSRYLYDLNRLPENCIYDEAWGKKVWKRPLTAKERQRSLSRHASYYRVLDELLRTIARKFASAIVYDLHSYNYKRHGKDTPLFNIGTFFIDKKSYQPLLEHLARGLQNAIIENVENRVAFDEMFEGKGYQAAFIHRQHQRCLCVPVEVKKVFMDEASGEPYPTVMASVKEALKQAFGQNAAYFSGIYATKKLRPEIFISSALE